MASEVHIYTAKKQLATGWVDTHSGEPIKMGFEPQEILYPLCCQKQRPASDCVVQSYYNGFDVWCAPNKGCKDPLFIAEKKAREFHNRSVAQKKRYKKENNNGIS